MKAVDDLMRALATLPMPWWVWPAAQVTLALTSLALALFFRPLDAEWIAWPWGGQFGDTCAMLLTAGIPCPQCGMSRAWVYGIRGDVVTAFFYNPAGLALLYWVLIGGVIGAVRLIARDPRRLRLPDSAFFAWVLFWFVPLYIGGYVLRLGGLNALP